MVTRDQKCVGSVTMTQRNKSVRYTLSPVSVVRDSSNYPFDDSPTSFERRQAEPVRRLAPALFQGGFADRWRADFGWRLKISGWFPLRASALPSWASFPSPNRVGIHRKTESVDRLRAGIQELTPGGNWQASLLAHLAASTGRKARKLPTLDAWICRNAKKTEYCEETARSTL